MYANITPDRAGMIMGLFFVPQSIGSIVTLTVMSSYPPAANDLTFFYVLFVLVLVNMLILALVPRKVFKPRLYTVDDLPTTEQELSCKCAANALKVWGSKKYRAYRYAVASQFAQLTAQTLFFTFMSYYAEDYSQIGKDAVSWFAAVSGAAQGVMALSTVLLGKIIDWAGVYRVAIPSAMVAAGATAAIPFQQTSAPLSVITAALSLVYQFIALVGVPIVSSTLTDYSSMGRDFAGFQVVPSITSGVAIALMGTILPSFGNTGKAMTGGRMQYTALGYYVFFGLCGLLAATVLGSYFMVHRLTKKMAADAAGGKELV